MHNKDTLRPGPITRKASIRGHLYVLEFSDGSIKVGHANEPGKRIISSARNIAGRCHVTLTQRWVSEAHEGNEMNEKRLNHWTCRSGRPVFGFRGVFTEVSFAETVKAAQLLMDDMELALLMSAPVSIRDLFPGAFGYRLRHAALSGINPNPHPYWRSRQQG